MDEEILIKKTKYIEEHIHEIMEMAGFDKNDLVFIKIALDPPFRFEMERIEGSPTQYLCDKWLGGEKEDKPVLTVHNDGGVTNLTENDIVLEGDNNIYFSNDSREIIRIKPNGDIIYEGRKITNDMELVNAFRGFFGLPPVDGKEIPAREVKKREISIQTFPADEVKNTEWDAILMIDHLEKIDDCVVAVWTRKELPDDDTVWEMNEIGIYFMVIWKEG